MTLPTAEILVIGHRNPDTDAICSAMAYADLYARLTGAATVPCHLDEIGPETAWLLGHLALPAPRQIADVYLRVADVMVADAPHLGPADTVRRAGLLMHDHELSALPVLDADGRLLGVVARDRLADRYLALLSLVERISRPLHTVASALEAELVAGDPDTQVAGRVWVGTFSPEAARRLLAPGDVLIIEDDPELQLAAVGAGAGVLVVARGAPLAGGLADAARARGAALVRTERGSLACAALLEQSQSVGEIVERNSATVQPDDVLDEAQAHLREGNLACLPVVAPDGHYLGLLLRRHLVAQSQRRVILTDHNHPGQAAPGVAESDVLAIVDHHNLGGLQTLQPLTMQVEPVGCTCTIIAEQYRRAGLTPAAPLAGAMLGAILSDTVQFRSPTTTPRDRTAAAWLAELSGENVDTLARRLFRARLPDPPPPAAWWVGRDWKVYDAGDTRIGIAQVELVDVEEVIPPIDDLRRELAAAAEGEGLLTAFLMLTDILEGGSVLLASNAAGERIAREAFGHPFADGKLALPGVVSRKKQVAPVLLGRMQG
jgi:manganese-dependent inorganic pyrophosphatase